MESPQIGLFPSHSTDPVRSTNIRGARYHLQKLNVSFKILFGPPTDHRKASSASVGTRLFAPVDSMIRGPTVRDLDM